MDTMTLEAFSDLVHQVYEAGLYPAKWPVFIEALAGLIDDSIVCLQVHDTTAGDDLGFLSSQADPDFLGSYSEYYSAHNIWARGMLDAHVGQVVQAEEICPRDELVKSEFYNDYLRKQDLATAVGTVLHRSPDKFLFLSANIRERAADRIQMPTRKMFELLSPHICRAFSLTRSLPPVLEDEDLRDAIEQSAEAVLLLNRSGRLVHANRLGADMLRQADTLSAERNGTLHFYDPRAERTLQLALDAFARHGFTQSGGDITGQRLNGSPLSATISPISDGSTHAILGQFFEKRPVAMLVVHSATAHTSAATALGGYGLTAAELALALAIAQGRSPREYADARDLSVHTVRTQLKSVFAKTGTRRQSQLAALAAYR